MDQTTDNVKTGQTLSSYCSYLDCGYEGCTARIASRGQNDLSEEPWVSAPDVALTVTFPQRVIHKQKRAPNLNFSEFVPSP
eukprot:2433582-Amphidinium_carterae.1